MRNTDEIVAAVSRALQAIPKLKSLGALPPALEGLVHLAPHPGKTVRVSLHRGAEGDGASITFVPTTAESLELGADERQAMSEVLVRVIDESERQRRFPFIALKFLRDRLLPGSGHVHFSAPERCRLAVEESIQAGYLTTARLPNPKNPRFPVTGVTLNRQHPDVIRWLSSPDRNDSGKNPPPDGADASNGDPT